MATLITWTFKILLITSNYAFVPFANPLYIFCFAKIFVLLSLYINSISGHFRKKKKNGFTSVRKNDGFVWPCWFVENLVCFSWNHTCREFIHFRNILWDFFFAKNFITVLLDTKLRRDLPISEIGITHVNFMKKCNYKEN